MSLPNPFNSVDDLMGFTSFRQGSGGPQDSGDLLQQSATDGTFAISQFEQALQRARNEIYRKTGSLDNDAFDEARKAELTEAELWLATARLYPMYGEKIALKFPESNLAGVGDLTLGADTPSPVEKGQHWFEFMASRCRAMGDRLLRGDRWAMQTFASGYDTTLFPFEQHYRG